MNSWCETCARKSCCYTMEIRPKCYLPTTNTAHGTPESYLAKALRFSRDSHEIAKDEPQTDCPKSCPSRDICTKNETDCPWNRGTAMGIEPQTSGLVWTEDAIKNEPKSYTTWASTDEPQTYITENRDTQILDAWQVHHRNTTSVEDEPQTERSE